MSTGLLQLRLTFGKVLIALLSTLTAGICAFAAVRGASLIATLAFGLTLCGVSTMLWLRDPVGDLTRYISSASLAGVVALLVLQNAGGGYQIDMHMAFFAALAVVAVWCCWLSILVAGATIAVHHLVLNFVYPYAVFPEGADFSRVIKSRSLVMSSAWRTKLRLTKSAPARAAQRALSRSSRVMAGTLNFTPGRFTPCRLRTVPLCRMRHTARSF